MNVFLKPVGLMSKAMIRVARALTVYAPTGVRIVHDPKLADVEILHVIGAEAIEHPSPNPVVIQYCLGSSGAQDTTAWVPLWERARLVWSYYDLTSAMPPTTPFYHAPLGVDQIFTEGHCLLPRNVGVMTSGYVAGPGAEAIEEMATAASRLGMRVIHLGPVPTRLTKPLPKLWANVHEIADNALVNIYSKCQWVSGLRFVEGFELPALEGLVCGARPIMFDRVEARRWYGDHAVYVPECDGEALVGLLVDVLSKPPKPVEEDERQEVIKKFDWETIAGSFWQTLLQCQTKERANEQAFVGW